MNTVKVTQAIINRAKPKDCYRCLIAMALEKATGREWHVWFEDARCDDKVAGRRVWKLPERVRRARIDFDAGDTVKPFAFKLPARFFKP